ncbi:MAG: hypothetical protein HRU26_08850 [Psychroserpens sp.]|nr:hypothetical protein [Psychroserpens sp.]
MLNPRMVVRQLIPILRPNLLLNDSELTSFKLIKAPTDASKEESPFGTIQIIASDQVGTTEKGWVISDVGQQFKEHLDMTVRINTFKADANYRMNLLRSKLKNGLVQSQFTANGFGFVDTSTVQDLTGLNTTKYEERARMDLRLYVAVGDLNQFVSTDPEDIGKAGVGVFYDIDPIERIDIVTFAEQDLENTMIITKDD